MQLNGPRSRLVAHQKKSGGRINGKQDIFAEGSRPAIASQLTCYHPSMPPLPSTPPLVRISSVRKVYDADGEPVVALKNVSLSVDAGEFLALMGPSGCGKSTLLHIMGAMDRPTEGEAWIEDTPIHRLPEEELTLIRRNRVGFVFQFFHLLPTMTVEENVALPLLLANGGGVDHARVATILQTVGLEHRRRARPNQLSGGELQRAALARAIVHEPPLVVADEPTGNLDSENGRIVLELLGKLAAGGTAIVMATHSDTAAEYATRTVGLKDGQLEPQPPRPPQPPEQV